MNEYEGFAKVYDKFMDDIDYDKWIDYTAGLLCDYGINNGSILELGCGSGNGAIRLYDRGYNVTAIDISCDMLNEAIKKKGGRNIIFSLQDMKSFEAGSGMDAVVSLVDAVNYVTDYDELVEMFGRVEYTLRPGGVFVFDVKTVRFFRNIGEQTIADNRDDCSFIWDNCFDENTDINEYRLSIFVRGDDGRYDKYEEYHEQRGYYLSEIKKALNEAGLNLTGSYEAFTLNEASEECDRFFITAVKKG